MTRSPEADDCNKIIVANFLIKNSHYSFVEKCKRICKHNDRQIRVKGCSNYSKCERNVQLKQRFLIFTKKGRYINKGFKETE